MAYDISSWNRKPAGPASKEDLDRRAMRLLPDWAKGVVREVAVRHRVPIHEIFGKSKAHAFAIARREAIYRVKFEKPTVSSGQLGLWFNRDHSTIIFALARFQELTGAPMLTQRRPPDRSAASNAFVIEAVGICQPQLYWSNDYGWGDRNGATVFRAEERHQLDLPVGGRWVELDYSQLAEIEKKR